MSDPKADKWAAIEKSMREGVVVKIEPIRPSRPNRPSKRLGRRAEIAAEKKAIFARAEELRGLLREFGLTLAGFDPGVLARTERGGTFQFDGAQWGFLEPLLKELAERRRG